MPSPSEWRSSMSFSDRLAMVMKMTTAYQGVHPSIVPAQAQHESTTLESQAFDTAESATDYKQKCEVIINDLLKQATLSSSATEETSKASSHSTPTGIDIGKYSNATHHQDGLFSIVYKAIASDNSSIEEKVVALKVTVPSSMEPPHDSRREARILEKSKSANVIPLLEAMHQSGGRLVLVFPFMPHALDELIQKHLLSKSQTKNCLRDLFRALAFIHSHEIIHRDVKPSNILLKSVDGPAYLSDFGIAWARDDPASEPPDSKITDVGTTCYRPPELLFGNRKYGSSLDLWAAGCTMAEVLDPDHQTLFDSGELGSELALIQSIFKKLGTPTLDVWPEAAGFPDWGKMEFYEYPPKPWPELLPKASHVERDAVSKLVRYESGARMTAAEVLGHSYFTE